MSIAVIDCGSSNLRSALKAVQKFDPGAFITIDKAALLGATGIVLPGVGAFDAAMKFIREKGLEDTILQLIAVKRPFLGICLGMQILFEESEEGAVRGLGVIKGKVKKFKFSGFMNNLKIPHMGWNRIMIKQPANPLFTGIEEGTMFYFVHSYYGVPEDPAVVAATTDYGVNFVSSVWQDNLFATQFHPEKSGENGLKVVGNFVKICQSKVRS
ncbi:MAG: imidazole glycerol phosphate synthase subunit HisH [Candidatus Saganbacteria bacterium]|nr:imidazole glycerol phosphate synthase subunit HisH [Candidatus Saganbacteria bacterium]